MRFTLDRYLAGKVLAPLAAAFAIGFVFLLADRANGLLANTLGKGNVLGAMFQMLAYLSPYYIGMAIPTALFLGVLLGWSRLWQGNEIAAFLAAGIGLHRLALPILFLALFFLTAALVVIGWLQPYGRYAYRAVMFDVQNVEVFYLAEESVFMRAGTRTFIFDELDRAEGKARRIFIYDDRGASGFTTVTAKEGQILGDGKTARPTLRLDDGLALKVETKRAMPVVEPAHADVSRFDRADTPVGQISDKVFRARGIDERELTLLELLARQSDPPSGSSPRAMAAELHNRLVRMLTIPVLPFLAIPFALTRGRGHQAYNIGVAIILLFIYNHFIERGTAVSLAGDTTPWLVLWGPFAVMTLFTIWRFWIACFTIRGGSARYGGKLRSLAYSLERAGMFRRLKARSSPIR